MKTTMTKEKSTNFVKAYNTSLNPQGIPTKDSIYCLKILVFWPHHAACRIFPNQGSK